MSKLNLHKFKMGYILAYTSDKSFIARMIKKQQIKQGFLPIDAETTHVEISGGGKHSIEIVPPRSRLIDITKRHKGRHVRVLRYKSDHYQYKGRYKVAYFSATLCNLGYDIPGVLSFLYKWIKQSNRLWFCSEGVLHSLRMVYPNILPDVRVDKCMPAHYVKDNCFEEVWEGIID